MANGSFGGRPVCVLISDANFVGYHLAELLLAQNCVVCVYSNQPEVWVRELSALKDNEFLKIFSLTATHPETCDYLFFISGFSTTPSLAGLPLATVLAKKFSPKFYVLLPLVRPSSLYEEIVAKAKEKVWQKDFSAEIVYLGEVFGPRMDLNLDWASTALISKVVNKEELTATGDEELYPIFVGEALRGLIKAAFSYGFEKKETVLAARVSRHSFIDRLIKLEDKDLRDTLVWLTGKKRLIVPQRSEASHQESKKDFEIRIPIPQVKIPKFPKVHFKRFSPAILALALVVALSTSPYVALGASGLILKGAYSNFTQGKIERVSLYLTTADKLTAASVGGMRLLSSAPLFGRWLGYGLDASIVAQQAAASGQQALRVLDLATQIVSGIFGSETYDLETLSESLSLELESLYQETSFLESEIKGRFPELTSLRFLAANSSGLARSLPDLLGEEGMKTYLVAFQNNTELRPTGGFIGSFALATFSKGKLLDVNVMDVYSADGQLKGHVEPPLPIKYYLGEANWFLRDANWDPDFPTAATQVEWFLDKEIDRAVDGVIAVDLEVAKAVLDQIGAVELPDFNQTIDSKNLYERVQYEVEEDFFPGSRKKANLLSALAQAMLTRIKELGKGDYIALSKKLFGNLRERHIQIFLHHRDAANAISSLGWDGRLVEPSCAGNCAITWFGAIEANVGVNKANYFIDRQMVLTSRVTEEEAVNLLVIDLKNNSPAALGLTGKYKSYLRVVLPGTSQVGEIVIDSSGKKEAKEPEIFQKSGRIEAGVVAQVPSGQRTRVIFSWRDKVSLDFTQPGEYQVFWRKQAGTVSDSVSINVSFPAGVELKGDLIYNTSLTEDLVKSFFW